MISRDRLLLIGHPVGHSLSPAMHNAALDAAGIALRYEAIDVVPAQLRETLERLAAQNCAGNFTLPHKRAAIGSMGAVSAAATAAGVVNTFWSDQDGHIAGDNTDVAGFRLLAEQTVGEVPNDSHVAVIGAGGGAAAVLAAVRQWKNCTATIHARSAETAELLCRRFSGFARASSMEDPILGQANIVVNATPIGLLDNLQPVAIDRLAADAVVLDLVYGANETAWVRSARENGHRASDGLSMLVKQGALSFRRWFGIDPDEAVMWRAVSRATGRRVGRNAPHR